MRSVELVSEPVLSCGIMRSMSAPDQKTVSMTLPSLSNLSISHVRTDMRWQGEPDYVPHEAVEQDGDSCPICLLELQERLDEEGNSLGPPVRVCPVSETDGGHVLHESCYEKVRGSGINRCPECRQAMRAPYQTPGLYYTGVGAQRRLVRNVMPSGQVHEYMGSQGREAVRSVKFPGGQTQYFLGSKGNEHKVRTVTEDGSTLYFRGTRRREYLVESTHPNGTHQYFRGSKNEERRVKAVFQDGEVRYYTGPKNHEVRVRAEFPDGRVEHYAQNSDGTYRVTRTERPGQS